MNLDMLLFLIRQRQDILINEREIWWSSAGPNRPMQRALSRHARGLRVLLRYASTSVCVNPDLHRKYWYHAGSQHYRCELCERLKEVC